MRSETRKESYEGWPIPSIKNIEDEEGFSPFLSGFALDTDPSPGLRMTIWPRRLAGMTMAHGLGPDVQRTGCFEQCLSVGIQLMVLGDLLISRWGSFFSAWFQTENPSD